MSEARHDRGAGAPPEPMRARTRPAEGRDGSGLRSARGFAWWHDGRALVSEGVARCVPVASVVDALAAIEVEEGPAVPATGPIAHGALPFDPAAMAAAEMIIPRRLWTRDADGSTWLTEISGGPGPSRPAPADPPVVDRGPDGSGVSVRQWEGLVGEALRRIDAGQLDKVVVARQVTMTADRPISPGQVVRRLLAAQPGCYVFAADGFVGATPEMLVERHGEVVRSRPMAGTVGQSDERALSWLSRSGKNRWEHELVVDAVVRCLTRWCAERPVASEPHTEPFADLAHIVTEVTGTLSAPFPSALDLALELHPTPAVAGAPTEAALALISTLEPAPRGRYGGPVGWVDA
ncbi:MAG: chorismate-binding protein, partial [Acidimicrobiales bacterium]|nr:chorismate-binding protein [Acidimicrobiales bacterium]